MKSAPAIAFDYAPSRLILGGVLLLGAFAVLAVLASGMATQLKALVAVLAAAYAGYAAKTFSTSSIRRIAHGEAGWLLVDRNGDEQAVELRHHVRRGNLLVLEFSASAQRVRRFVLTPDNIDAETRRRLLLVLAAG
jgi:hypothetical protein